MDFDPDNKVIQLCTQGMSFEGQGNIAEARQSFLNAWKESTTDFEKFTSAHYVARHQDATVEKLKWDETALNFAIKIAEPSIKAYYPSLYLNIGKCHEDLNNYNSAREHYRKALSFSKYLPDDGYGQMIRLGISEGIRRVQAL